MNYRKPTKFYNWWKILPLYIIKMIFRTAAIAFLPIYHLSIHLRFIKPGQFHRTPEIQFMCRQRRFILCNMRFPFLSRAMHAHLGSPELSPCSVTWHCGTVPAVQTALNTTLSPDRGAGELQQSSWETRTELYLETLSPAATDDFPHHKHRSCF